MRLMFMPQPLSYRQRLQLEVMQGDPSRTVPVLVWEGGEVHEHGSARLVEWEQDSRGEIKRVVMEGDFDLAADVDLGNVSVLGLIPYIFGA